MSLMRPPPIIITMLLCIFIILDHEIEKIPLCTLLLVSAARCQVLGLLGLSIASSPTFPLPKLSPAQLNSLKKKSNYWIPEKDPGYTYTSATDEIIPDRARHRRQRGQPLPPPQPAPS